MSVENLSEFRDFHSRYENGQKQPANADTPDQEKAVTRSEESDVAAGERQPVKVTAQSSAQQAEDEIDKEAIIESLKSINQQFPLKSTSLIFEFDDITDPPVIKVVDKESGDIIRELPPKELREIAQALSDIADNLSNEAGSQRDKHNSGILINEQL